MTNGNKKKQIIKETLVKNRLQRPWKKPQRQIKVLSKMSKNVLMCKTLVTSDINVKLGHVGSVPICNLKFVKDGLNSSYIAALWARNGQNDSSY